MIELTSCVLLDEDEPNVLGMLIGLVGVGLGGEEGGGDGVGDTPSDFSLFFQNSTSFFFLSSASGLLLPGKVAAC